jgi:hypothetical protein
MSRRNEGDQGQPSFRRRGFVTDQHGRVWVGSIDKKSGFPVGMMEPLAKRTADGQPEPRGWSAPWYPPQSPETFRYNPDDPSKLTINYEWLLAQRMADAKEYDDDRRKKALVRGWDPTDPEKQEALDSICGARDGLQHPEIVVACMQGDKWILGLTDVVNPKVARFIPKKVDRKTAMLSKFPDFTVQDEAELEERLDLEEQFDPDAVGGTKQKLPKKPKAKREVTA